MRTATDVKHPWAFLGFDYIQLFLWSTGLPPSITSSTINNTPWEATIVRINKARPSRQPHAAHPPLPSGCFQLAALSYQSPATGCKLCSLIDPSSEARFRLWKLALWEECLRVQTLSTGPSGCWVFGEHQLLSWRSRILQMVGASEPSKLETAIASSAFPSLCDTTEASLGNPVQW